MSLVLTHFPCTANTTAAHTGCMYMCVVGDWTLYVREQEIIYMCCINAYRMYLCSSIHCTCILYSCILDERRVALNTCLQEYVHTRTYVHMYKLVHSPASSAYVIGILTVLFIVTVGLKS